MLQKNGIKLDKAYWLIPLLISLLAKVFYFSNWVHSPFRYYSQISGLDMQYIISLKSTQYGYMSSLYYYFVIIVKNIFGINFAPIIIVAVQMGLGVISTLLIVYIAKQLFGSKKYALVAGIIYALYFPTFLNEAFVLKETFYCFFMLLSLSSLFYLKQRKISYLLLLVAGILAIIPTFIRYIGIVWVCLVFIWILYILILKNRKNVNIFLGLISFIIGVFIVVTPVQFANSKNISNFTILPFKSISYISNVGSKANAVSLNTSSKSNNTTKPKLEKNTTKEASTLTQSSNEISKYKVYLTKLEQTFTSYEIPNNVNGYFVKAFLSPLTWLISLIILLPFFIVGIFLLIVYWRKILHPELLLLYMIPSVLACVYFLPLERYRVAISPAVVLLATFTLMKLAETIKGKKYILTLILLLGVGAVAFLDNMVTPKGYLRSTDYIAYGQALKIKDPKGIEYLDAFAAAYEIRPDKENAVKNFVFGLLEKGQFELATKVIERYSKIKPLDVYLKVAYVAGFMGSKQLDKAKEVLDSIKISKNTPQKMQIYYNYGEYYLNKGDMTKANTAFKEAYKYVYPSAHNFKRYLKARIEQTNKGI